MRISSPLHSLWPSIVAQQHQAFSIPYYPVFYSIRSNSDIFFSPKMFKNTRTILILQFLQWVFASHSHEFTNSLFFAMENTISYLCFNLKLIWLKKSWNHSFIQHLISQHLWHARYCCFWLYTCGQLSIVCSHWVLSSDKEYNRVPICQYGIFWKYCLIKPVLTMCGLRLWGLQLADNQQNRGRQLCLSILVSPSCLLFYQPWLGVLCILFGRRLRISTSVQLCQWQLARMYSWWYKWKGTRFLKRSLFDNSDSPINHNECIMTFYLIWDVQSSPHLPLIMLPSFSGILFSSFVDLCLKTSVLFGDIEFNSSLVHFLSHVYSSRVSLVTLTFTDHCPLEV